MGGREREELTIAGGSDKPAVTFLRKRSIDVLLLLLFNVDSSSDEACRGKQRFEEDSSFYLIDYD